MKMFCYYRRILICVYSILLMFYGETVFAAREDCGPSSLFEACRLIGIVPDYDKLKEDLLVDDKTGTTFAKIEEVALKYGFKVDAFRLTPEQLLALKTPAIAYVKGNHFVTVAASDKNNRAIFVIDKSSMPYWQNIDEFIKTWNGETLIIKPRILTTGPKLWKYSNDIDIGRFGHITGEVREVTLINIGNKPLHLFFKKASCSCATVEFEPAEIPSGGYCKMKVTIDTSAKNPGPFSVKVLITTNNPEQPHEMLVLKGNIDRKTYFYPLVFNLGNLSPTTQNKTLVSRGRFSVARDINIVPEYISRGLQIDSISHDPNGVNEIVMKLELSQVEKKSNGEFICFVRFKTGIPENPNLVVSVDGRILPWLSAFPASVFVGNVNSGTRVEKIIKITNFCDSELKVDVADDGIAEAQVLGENTRVFITAPETTGVFHSWVRVTAKNKTLEIPIVGVAH